MVTIVTMTSVEYKDIEHPAPYVLHLEGEPGTELLYYGVRHSCDPADPRRLSCAAVRFVVCAHLEQRPRVRGRVFEWLRAWHRSD